MRICFIELQPFPGTVGGGITHLKEISKELIDRGNDVTVISSPPEKDSNKDKKIRTIYAGMKHKKLADFNGIKRIGYYFWRPFFELSFINGTKKILNEEIFDIIVAQSPITPSLPCSLSKKDFFITAHGIHNRGFKKLYKEQGNKIVSNIGSYIYNKLEKYNIKKAKKIICLGKESYDYYSKMNKCVEIPNGINTKIFFDDGKEKKKTIISVGRFTEQKAVDKLIEAMDHLKDYKLEIIGLGPLEGQVKKMCSERSNCTFLGYKETNEIKQRLRKAKFTILPSLFEGLPISMLEAMACGVIPITTKVGDIPSVIKEGKTGFFLEGNDPKEIAETVRRAEKKNLKEIRANCSGMIKEKYSWSKIVDRYLEAWKKN